MVNFKSKDLKFNVQRRCVDADNYLSKGVYIVKPTMETFTNSCEK